MLGEMATTIVFDGDQTLWDFRSAMLAALLATRSELCRATSLPDCAIPTVEELVATRDRVAEQRQGDRLEAVRRAGFEAVLVTLGLRDDELLDRLCDVYFEQRHALVRAFPDAVPCLDELAAAGHRLILLTNGNSQVDRIGLAGHFDARFHADEIGHRKPSPEVYALVAGRMGGTDPLLSIGDSLANDVVGPQLAGWLAIWLNRDDEPLPPGFEPDAMVTDLRTIRTVVADLT